jgi:hypothetical protein
MKTFALIGIVLAFASCRPPRDTSTRMNSDIYNKLPQTHRARWQADFKLQDHRLQPSTIKRVDTLKRGNILIIKHY